MTGGKDGAAEGRRGKTEPKPRPGASGPARTVVRKQPSAMTDNSEERRAPTLDDGAQFEVSLSEGNTFRNMGQYRKAINSYTRVSCIYCRTKYMMSLVSSG